MKSTLKQNTKKFNDETGERSPNRALTLSFPFKKVLE